MSQRLLGYCDVLMICLLLLTIKLFADLMFDNFERFRFDSEVPNNYALNMPVVNDTAILQFSNGSGMNEKRALFQSALDSFKLRKSNNSSF